MEKIIYSTFHILIKIDNFGLVNFFEKCSVWEIASVTKNSKSRKGMKKDKFDIFILL